MLSGMENFIVAVKVTFLYLWFCKWGLVALAAVAIATQYPVILAK
jgi:hypothetical protein